jgi:hypothetical protein
MDSLPLPLRFEIAGWAAGSALVLFGLMFLLA